MIGWLKCHLFNLHTWVYPTNTDEGVCRYCKRSVWYSS
jgi:hypothetical protein